MERNEPKLRLILEPYYTNQKSFYNKAIVEQKPLTGETILYSYNIKIATIRNGNITLHSPVLWSKTTLKHLREFLSQSYGEKLNVTKKHLARYLGETVILNNLIEETKMKGV